MKQPLVLPTEQEGFVLRELDSPSDDLDFQRLIHPNVDSWTDIAYLDDMEAIRDSRLSAEDERELRLGMSDKGKLVGYVSLITYGTGDEDGNWLGFYVDKQHLRHGYGFLSARAAIGYVAVTPDLDRKITTTTMPGNIPAIKLLERLGFMRDEVEHQFFPGQIMFRLLVNQ